MRLIFSVGFSLAVFGAPLLVAQTPVMAQTPPANPPAANAPTAAPSGDVVVRGVRGRVSDWREAETSHVIVLSDGPAADVARVARNLERLHFLLSGLLGRPDVADDTVKLRVTLIGDVPEFAAMQLVNRRWQQGPFSDFFQVSRYYDPRDDGAVMASTRIDQRTVIEHTPLNAQTVAGILSDPAISRSIGTATQAGGQTVPGGSFGTLATIGLLGEHDLPVTFGENAIEVPADGLLYAGYAQHYLQTYFPAAYPRWYLDGFGQVFSSLVVKGDRTIEYGRSPKGVSAVLSTFGSFPIKDVLNDQYLTEPGSKTRWTPIHAWLLTHFLLFSDQRRPQLNRYLALRAGGADAATAAAAFGDQVELAKDLRAYFRARKPYDVVTYPADRIEEPVVRRLTLGQAAFVKGRLELGARVTIPAEPPAGLDPKLTRKLADERQGALHLRDRWLVGLRADAARWSGEPGAQLLLAEAECRSGHADECLAAADRAHALAPSDDRPLAWKGMALAMQAAALPPEARADRLRTARATIAAANRLDLEAVEPLLAYSATFALVGETPSQNAIDALDKAMGAVPSAPSTRVSLAEALVARGPFTPARQVVLPVAAGAYDSPERPVAAALVARIASAETGVAGGHLP